MEIPEQSFAVDDKTFVWGQTLREVDKLLSDHQHFTPYGGWANIRCVCKTGLNFPAIEFEARSPSMDKPVMQVEYKLAPYDATLQRNDHAFWSDRISWVCGQPADVYENKNETSSGSVTYSANWFFDSIRITLSVYGGLRKEDSGISAAALFIYWEDYITAAQPFLEKQKQVESELFSNNNRISDLKKYTLEKSQAPYSLVDKSQVKYDPELLRKSKRALYYDHLLETPAIIKQELSEYEFAFYRILNSDNWAISTQWNTTVFNEKSKITWLNTLPAKGGGRTSLSINEFSVEDVHSSQEIKKCVNDLKASLNLEIAYNEDYDC